jgi:hypothetical protein
MNVFIHPDVVCSEYLHFFANERTRHVPVIAYREVQYAISIYVSTKTLAMTAAR